MQIAQSHSLVPITQYKIVPSEDKYYVGKYNIEASGIEERSGFNKHRSQGSIHVKY